MVACKWWAVKGNSQRREGRVAAGGLPTIQQMLRIGEGLGAGSICCCLQALASGSFHNACSLLHCCHNTGAWHVLYIATSAYISDVLRLNEMQLCKPFLGQQAA